VQVRNSADRVALPSAVSASRAIRGQAAATFAAHSGAAPEPGPPASRVTIASYVDGSYLRRGLAGGAAPRAACGNACNGQQLAAFLQFGSIALRSVS
jgi:hypothetical protein